jgi:LemA protein
MKTGIKILIVVVVLVILALIVGTSLAGAYNGLVEKQVAVEKKLADIDTLLQRRLDLIPNLVSSVKGYTAQELKVIDSITAARAALSGATTLAEKDAANTQINGLMRDFLAIYENYPDIKSSTLFTGLMDELAGTENRISVARKDYNDAVQAYNTAIRRFPTNLIAGMFGFAQSEYFQASAEASSAPQVTF